jgi:UTP:GlnB (protein PII) uridylyltransferase
MGLSIWFAKINTEGDRVADVFYVSDRSGRKVEAAARLGRIGEELTRAAETTEPLSRLGLPEPLARQASA